MELEYKDLGKEHEQDEERRLRRKPECTWANWLAVYTICMGVIARAQPEWAIALIQYQDLIHRAYADFLGQACHFYDEQFHKESC